ncbi:hypothetical protein NM208_g13370 [Fusarium decemcellulare]|uniref:Uncharacterized protein n=1 Tax=Fusarium decemcellulare TaxID=57161 RepID=A0ACC1RKT4_9HYPO|nr:hypothetical protein NM208_g13370 [Fusarium decemcellulare]
MILSRHVWLLAGLCGLGAAQTANMDIWAVDPSCDTHGSYLQDSFNQALELATEAQNSLNFALNKRPDANKDPEAYKKWNRIAEAIRVTLGFAPSRSRDEGPGDANWSGAFDIFGKIVTGLQASQNSPPDGYVPKLKSRDGAKPRILCGDDAFEWIGPDDKIPGQSSTLMQDSQFSRFFLEGAAGTWHNDARLVWKREEKGKPVLCFPGLRAAVYFNYDLVTFCDRMFTDDRKSAPTPKSLREGDTIKAGDAIDSYARHLSVTVLHELTHWFGGLSNTADYNSAVIDDQTAVDYDGKFLYEPASGGARVAFKNELSAQDMKKQGLKRSKTYGRRDIWNLARTGPKKSLKSADSLTYFALMVYLDKWDWSRKGEAR